jgi:SAM-dependent methyltransferase
MLELAITHGAGELGKLEGVVNAFRDVWSGRVLDCGSRSGNLRYALRSLPIEYTSLDLTPPAQVIASLDERLPFADRSYDICVALDVLEHTNDFHFAFRELCRVARRHVVVSLPNCLELRLRLRLLRGRHISAKYGLGVNPRADRHRWFLSLDDSREFSRFYPKTCGFTLVRERALVGQRRGRLAPLIRRWPNAWTPTYLALFERR